MSRTVGTPVADPFVMIAVLRRPGRNDATNGSRSELLSTTQSQPCSFHSATVRASITAGLGGVRHDMAQCGGVTDCRAETTAHETWFSGVHSIVSGAGERVGARCESSSGIVYETDGKGLSLISATHTMHAHTFRRVSAAALLFGSACGGLRTIGRERNAEKITRAEIVQGSYATAYDVVQRLHPNWLRAHNGDNEQLVSQIVVYYDGTRYGPIASLSSIRANVVNTIEHIDGPSATIRFGGGNSEGVLYVTSLRR